MKKFLSFIVALILTAAVCAPVSVQAETDSYILLEFSDIKYDANKTDNQVWFSIDLVGDYEKYAYIYLDFDYDESVLKPGLCKNDDIPEQNLYWEGSSLVIDASVADNLRNCAGFEVLSTGDHKLSVQARVVFDGFSGIGMMNVRVKGLRDEVLDSTTYDSKVTFPEVMHFDAENEDSLSNRIAVPVSVREIALYEYACVEITFNPDVLEYETSYFTDDGLYSKDFICTENSVCFKATFNDTYHDRDNSIFCNESGSATHIFNVTGTGNPEISVSAYAMDLNGKRVELTVSLNDFYGEILNKNDLYFLEKTDVFEYVIPQRFILNRTMTTEMIDRYFSSHTTVLDKDGIRIINGENIPTGARIVTLYKNRYIVDEQQVTALGDVNCDGKVSAADARSILRISADLEFADYWLAYEAADCDGKKGITASDARLVLRVAAGIDSFPSHVIEMKVGDVVEFGPLKNAGSGAYNWSCKVSAEDGLTVNDDVNPPENVEIRPGTPFEWTFTVTADKAGEYNLVFELGASWEAAAIDTFAVDIIVTD